MARRDRRRKDVAHAAGGTPATSELHEAAVPFTEHEYAHDPRATSYGLEAAQALGLDPAVVFKTLLLSVEGMTAAAPGGAGQSPGQLLGQSPGQGSGHGSGAGLGVVVLPVDTSVDLKAAATAFGGKRPALADPAAAQRSTGYVVGGISPFGQKRRLPTVLDESAQQHPAIYVSGGRRGYDLGVAPDDLVRVLGARVAAIAR
ncbi:Cys-tRNA(Pro)/Cys-tRNA(Cys) deacylase [Kineosphaera limosa]|uniref:aminoacyl-tRNA deacylase n=1 Tax=Kineosphaera limosa TaxID=111564 RepID=UPI0002F0529E|nr:aminoacyl-tRNA deacylase [Kineosphaera limosa]NYE03231.1 Cys-tRNA(Pro)/Cys-tRNA(Cys) deacylase [Kineosphaera limosa]